MSEIGVLAELERIGWSYEWAGDDEIRCRCPFHEDATPSCGVNVARRLFKCHAADCGASGDIVTFLARALKTTRAVVIADLSARYDFEEPHAIDGSVIEKWHAQIWKAKPLLAELYKRGVTDDMIREYRIGEHDGRVTIPIKSAAGLFVNVRKYLPGAPSKDKMRNLRGHGKIRLYPIEQLKYDTIVLCGGEIKAIVAASQLNAAGIGAIATTAGEENWDRAFTPLFAGKRVIVCMDTDDGGVTSAQKHCACLKRVADWVGNLELPLDRDKYPHGDINDFVGQEHGSLLELLDAVAEWSPPSLSVLDDSIEPTDMDIRQATSAEAAGQRVRVTAVVSAMDTAPYVIPREVRITCAQGQKECALCPVFGTESPRLLLHPENAVLLEMVNASRAVQREALMRGFGIPITCKDVEFVAESYYNVEDTRVSPQLEITSRTADRVMQPAVCIGSGLELNESYVMTGRMYPHPKTQQSTLLISGYSPARDALSTYECHELGALETFAPQEWTIDGIQRQLDDVYADLEANVTRIYQRRDLHLTIDLAYHSPLLLQFDGKVVKGWTEVLVLGDSSQGKSETAMNLMRHYGLGEKVECKNASVAGLLGGLQQLGSRWFVTWGVIPTHDRRLVVLEELKGTSTEVIAKLTDMRSSGVAEIPKIEKRRTHARTRLVALSNPRSDQQLRSYSFGIEAVKELIGGLEDVRRFDFALLVSAHDISASVLNALQRSRPHVAPRFTPELCRALVLWTWTRTQDQVKFTSEATAAVLDHATSLSNEFTEAIPLVDAGSGRYKVARLAAALAGRTFSHAEDPQELLVRACHVEFVAAMLRRVYGGDVMGYGAFTTALRTANNMADGPAVKHKIEETPFPGDLVKQLLATNTIDVTDLQDWCSWERFEAMQLMSFFVRKRALVRDGRNYRKTPDFISLLRDLSVNGNLHDRPDFIGEF